MQDPDVGGAQQPAERLQVGPSRASLFEKVPVRWRLPALALLAFSLGVAACGGVALWWPDRPAPDPVRVDEHAVELVLFEAVPDAGQLQVDGALLLSGGVTSTVLEIDTLDCSLAVRAPQLPVTVSATDRFRAVSLGIVVRDCKAASRRSPGDRPFTIRWRDEFGEVHVDRAGDFGRTMAVSLTRYIDAVCDNPLGR